MYIYTEDDDRWMRAERAARERNQDVSEKVKKARIEVARQIFDDIANIMVLQHGFNENHIVAHIDFELLKELKKKYTE